jgi:hypothetical protein
MCDWLVFHPDLDAGLIHIEIKCQRLIELQPDSYEGTDAFCEEFYPIIDKIQEICQLHGLKQECSADVNDIDVKMIKPLTMMRIIWNVYNHTSDNILLTKCELQHTSPLFNTLYSTMKGFLPSFMRNIITLS